MTTAPRPLPRLLAALALALGLALGSAGTAGQAEGQDTDTAVFLQGLAPRTFDPARAILFEEAVTVEHLYSGLVRFDDRTLAIEPDLAEAWEVSEDGLAYVFSLRQDARFHDGRPVSAAAVADSFNRQLDSGHRHHRDDLTALRRAVGRVRRVEALDERRLRFTLAEPSVSFLADLASSGAKVVNPRVLDALGGDLSRADAGSGPYRLAQAPAGESVVMERFDGYFGARPAIRRLAFPAMADRQARMAEFLAGRASALTSLDPQDTRRLSLLSGVALTVQPSLGTSFLALNVRRPPCSVPAVRQAVRLALNRPNLVGLVYQDLALPARSLLPPGIVGGGTDLPADDYDPVRARQLLVASGLGPNLALDFLVLDTTRPYMPRPRELARAIRENLQAVGIEVRLQLLEMPLFLAAVRSGGYDLCLAGWSGDNGDPGNFFDALFQPPDQPNNYNLSGYADPAFLALLDAARGQRSPAERARLYQEAERRLHAAAALIPLAHAQYVLATRGGITGVVLHPTGLVRFQKAAFAP